MEKIFYWITAPDTSIPETDWEKFLSNMAAVTIAAILITTTLAVVLYCLSARARKIRAPGDVFSAYKPMRWIALSALAGVIVSIVCILLYLEPARRALDILGPALKMGGLTTLFTAVLAYLFIALVPGITPAKFVYRAAPFRAGK